MTNKYFTHTGGLETALAHLHAHGGQLYLPRFQEGAHTVVRGCHVHTFWPEKSPLRYKILELCSQFDVPQEERDKYTAGRLARYYCKEILGWHWKDTYFSPQYQALARSGHHWHYLKCKEGKYEYTIELDIKSAYAASLLSLPSLLYCDKKGFLDDGGAKERLGEQLPDLPKWFRMVLLGVISSHQAQFYYLDKKGELQLSTRKKIACGAAFNAVHLAIKKVYDCLAKIDSNVGEHIIRIHTDSLLWNLEQDASWDAIDRTQDYLKRQGFETTCKGAGRAILYHLDCGIIGHRPIGAKHDLISRLRFAGDKISPDLPEKGYYERALATVKEIAKDVFRD